MPKAHIIGLGKSGIAAARLLKQEGWEVEIADLKTSPDLLQQQLTLAKENIDVKLGYSLDLTASDLPQLIVASPGVPWDIPLLVKAREMGIETIGEMELAWRNLSSTPWIGVTGTNGKTTTTSLIAAIFQSSGYYAPACGNIGYAACEVALEYGEIQGNSTSDNSTTNSIDWIVAELSSYQIESSNTIKPRIGIWTTFTPDHLSRHKTLDNYYQIKAKLLRNSELKVFNGDDPYLRQVGKTELSLKAENNVTSSLPENKEKHTANTTGNNIYWTSVNGKENLINNQGFYIADGWVWETLINRQTDEKILETNSLRMVGEHNLQNLLLSVAAARLAGIEKHIIAHAVAEFPGVPHRLEHICNWEGIDFINDSKATNYEAAEVGLTAVDSPAILIAGGEAKKGNDQPWLDRIKEKASVVLLIGNAAEIFSQRLHSEGYNSYEIVNTMEKAVPRAAELAKQRQASVVLLSPACASFDQYPNFEERGAHFRKLCLDWQEKVGD